MLDLVLTIEDNPTFEGLFEFCSISAGGSVGASIFRLSLLLRHLYCTML